MHDPARKRFGVSVVCLAACLSRVAAAAADDARPVPKNDGATLLSSHPVVAGFERFGAEKATDGVEAGLLLLGELSCTSCHRAEPRLAAHVNVKQAPVLDGVGSRVRPAFLRSFLAAPHATKPGTTMPDLLAGWAKPERDKAVEALTHFLASTGGVANSRVDRKAVAAGGTLYEQVGCLACHGVTYGGKSAAAGTSVPLGVLEAKYTVPGLAAFLLDPLKARPSGRMPGLRLKPEEASQVAQYLLKDLHADSRPVLEYQYYEAQGSWDKLPDFSRLVPTKTGTSDGFDASVAARKDNIGLRFRGDFRAGRAGRYTFTLNSDDGSKLYVDDQLVADNDGTHPASDKQGSVQLAKGTHRLVVEFFNAAGEVALGVDVEGPGFGRQPVADFVTLANEATRKADGKKAVDTPFTVDSTLAARGRELFARVGCASCHRLKLDGKDVGPTSGAPALAALKAGGGCTARSPGKDVPRYDLNDAQRSALAAAIGAVATLSKRAPTPAQSLTRNMTALNCYACHERDGRGGVEPSRDAAFATTQKEMGDEGRLPPRLTGVGAKLNDDYLKQVLDDGAKDRPYMLTRMPRFGAGNGRPLLAAFTTLDHVAPVRPVRIEETPRRVKSDGRLIAGGMGLGCIKCHTFKGVQAEGIQAIDMTVMTRRLRRDWFHPYVINPPAFRPGTRMPTGWPDGKSMLPKVLDGDTAKQIEAVWLYLSDGPAAAEPYGLGREPMPLFAARDAVIYRNFIQGGGPRAIGVGYPEKANLAFDANDLRLAMIWQGGFMDASRHWAGRGEGFQPPMGDNVVSLPAGAPFASLSSPGNPWPSETSRALGYHFRGYRLGKGQRPTFLYDFGNYRVEDRPDATAGTKSPGVTRTLTVTSDAPADDLYLRVAVGDSVAPQGGGWYLVNGEWKVRIEAAAGPVVRSSGGKAELLVPVKFAGKTATVREQFKW